MNCGDSINGFTLKSIKPVREQDGMLYEFEHDKTRARLVWLSREDENKSFCIGFPTIPDNDCGMFHIIEHSVLNGSDKYPAKEPFVELMKSSQATFLNAFTYPDRTLYPVASRNQKDFENLVRVYMDAVFHPLIYSTPDIFYQEGWHYEPQEDGTFVRNGVVLNEMKGAFSSSDELLVTELNRLLYPDSPYRFVSGGHPDSIPRLSYEQFIAYHRKYYHPSNAFIILDGKLPIEKMLKLLDSEFICEFDLQPVDTDIPMQQACEPKESTIGYPAVGGVPECESAHMMLGYIAGSCAERKKMTALRLLSSYLAGDNDAALKKAILERGLGKDVEVGLCDGIKQPFFFISIKSTDKEKKAEIKSAVRETLENIAAAGIDKKRMRSTINNAEIQLKEKDSSWFPLGVELATEIMDGWIYGLDPAECLNTTEIFAALRRGIDEEYFENIIREVLLDSSNLAFVCAAADDTLAARQKEQERAEIECLASAWGEAKRQEIADRAKALKIRQTTPDSPEALASIPMLKLSDLNDRPTEIATEIKKEGSFTLWQHSLPTRGITYAKVYFPLPRLSEDELSLAALLCRLTGNLNTRSRSAEELKLGIRADLGKLNLSLLFVQDKESLKECKGYALLSISAVEENFDKALDYAREVLLETEYSDSTRIRSLITQSVEELRDSVIGSGNYYALLKAEARVSAAGRANELAGGFSYYQWLKAQLSHFDEHKDELESQLCSLSRRIFTSDKLIVSMTGAENNDWAERLAASIPAGEEKPKTLELILEDSAADGLEIPADVSYAAQCTNLFEQGDRLTGAMKVLAKYVTLDYLWQKVRVQGGAYGVSMSIANSGNIRLASYRDPNAASTLEAFSKIPEFIEESMDENADITGVILGTLADDDPLLPARDAGSAADARMLNGIGYEDLCRIRREILETRPEKLRLLVQQLKRALERRNICVAGPAGQLEKCGISESEKL